MLFIQKCSIVLSHDNLLQKSYLIARFNGLIHIQAQCRPMDTSSVIQNSYGVFDELVQLLTKIAQKIDKPTMLAYFKDYLARIGCLRNQSTFRNNR